MKVLIFWYTLCYSIERTTQIENDKNVGHYFDESVKSKDATAVSFLIWVGLPFTITKSKGQTHWGSRSILAIILYFNKRRVIILRLTIFRFYGFIKIMSDKRKTNPDQK
ncbi:hypothetical protein PHYBLDRAFT_66859 [Phycomyces blakesleeanus NRRL 1555(-)]|uniref:Uncharacterized protein n=1 Tax=Phycomyces blakesleeanus (strain ATCC 8743b / DSM 1359 / FGSC 10004 / NBRC 33097 / NRRL 1555) TaxID=763407 RepID=A0A163D6T3_PHYB8|nr:hypothetical protein PHYBLDRAFT_66859 [Phycomyces blakesleeanus NRRL 1555(-)]OAD69170.1 hypothetical protein PHYBLDRAFT_66859 [Phycomyces blakesleeanus NRRL 1555(-)]|eukprot:XP_018287210.1 hypothetical protein PHYBLDRAFT_66859 [Phycomyces blakesleeanus NRRL 1555(-)]